jgi:hypothetical protein
MNDPPISIIRARISDRELRAFLDNPFPDMVKFVVDIEDEVIALGGELHADAEQILLEEGCSQRSIWGGNIYPDAAPGKKIEYTALINIRPSQDNRSMEVQSVEIRKRMHDILERLIGL